MILTRTPLSRLLNAGTESTQGKGSAQEEGVRFGLPIFQQETAERLRRKLQRGELTRAALGRGLCQRRLAPGSKERSALAAHAQMQGMAHS